MLRKMKHAERWLRSTESATRSIQGDRREEADALEQFEDAAQLACKASREELSGAFAFLATGVLCDDGNGEEDGPLSDALSLRARLSFLRCLNRALQAQAVCSPPFFDLSSAPVPQMGKSTRDCAFGLVGNLSWPSMPHPPRNFTIALWVQLTPEAVTALMGGGCLNRKASKRRHPNRQR